MRGIKNAIIGGALIVGGSIMIGAVGIIQAITGGIRALNIRVVLPLFALVAIIIFFAGIIKCLDSGSKDS